MNTPTRNATHKQYSKLVTKQQLTVDLCPARSTIYQYPRYRAPSDLWGGVREIITLQTHVGGGQTGYNRCCCGVYLPVLASLFFANTLPSAPGHCYRLHNSLNDLQLQANSLPVVRSRGVTMQHIRQENQRHLWCMVYASTCGVPSLATSSESYMRIRLVWWTQTLLKKVSFRGEHREPGYNETVRVLLHPSLLKKLPSGSPLHP